MNWRNWSKSKTTHPATKAGKEIENGPNRKKLKVLGRDCLTENDAVVG